MSTTPSGRSNQSDKPDNLDPNSATDITDANATDTADSAADSAADNTSDATDVPDASETAAKNDAENTEVEAKTPNQEPAVWLGCEACYNDGKLVGRWYSCAELTEPVGK